MSEPQRHRCRITFAKEDAMRFTGHLDLHHAWERMLRRAGAPVVRTQGYNPRLRISLGLALPLGFTSDCELIDIWLEGAPPAEELLRDLQRAAPPGLRLLGAAAVGENEPALQKLIQAATYAARAPEGDNLPALQARIQDLLGSPAILRQRRGKAYDLRPLIESLEARPPDGPGSLLVMRLAARDGATGRPEEVLLSLDLDPLSALIHRVQIHLN